MSEPLKQAAWSFATTFVVTFVALIPLASALDGDFSWVPAAAGAAVTAAARTLVAALNPKSTAYGIGSK